MNIEESIKNLENKINEQRQILESVAINSERMRKYFQWSFILTIVFFVLPLIALVFVVPMALSSYTSALNFGI